MIKKTDIEAIIGEHLAGTDLFLIDLKVSPSNRISVYIDGDNGVTIDNCIALSRAIEGSLDREEEDFELNVSSAGAEQPLKLKRQYIKNKGRNIQVLTLSEEIIEGKLIDADDNKIVIEPKKKKKGAKGKEILPLEISYEEIEEAKIVIMF